MYTLLSVCIYLRAEYLNHSEVRVILDLPLKHSLCVHKLAIKLGVDGYQVGQHHCHHRDQVESLMVLPFLENNFKRLNNVLRRYQS